MCGNLRRLRGRLAGATGSVDAGCTPSNEAVLAVAIVVADVVIIADVAVAIAIVGADVAVTVVVADVTVRVVSVGLTSISPRGNPVTPGSH